MPTQTSQAVFSLSTTASFLSRPQPASDKAHVYIWMHRHAIQQPIQTSPCYWGGHIRRQARRGGT